jgi:hypothetical protein
MAREFTNGRLEKFMMENGAVAVKKVTEYGKEKTVTPTLENGKTQKLTVMVYTHGHRGINTKANGRNA